MMQRLHHKGITYEIIKVEGEFLIHPIALGILPDNKISLSHEFTCSYEISNYKLYLMSLTIDGVVAELSYPLTVSYDGAILIGNTLVDGYDPEDKVIDVCAYRNAYELIFEQGILITTVDQRKSMQRVRKNIEMGLRNLTKQRDIRCIKRFLNTSLIGDYKPFSSDKKRLKYIEHMKNGDNHKTNVSFLEKN